MDAEKFLRETLRMCRAQRDCASCPADGGYCVAPGEKIDLTKCVEIVEKWASEHPAKTRQSEFLKVIPSAPIIVHEDLLNICPSDVDANHNCDYASHSEDSDACGACKRKYWLTEVD